MSNSSLKPFRYTYLGSDGKYRCMFCKVYRAHVSIDEPDAFGIKYIDLCRACIERMRITLKLALNE